MSHDSSVLIGYHGGNMVISYHGGECFKVSFSDVVLAFNPSTKEGAKSLKTKEIKFGADVALISMHHPHFEGVEQVTYGEKTPFVIDGPGEYEIGDVTVRGIAIETLYDGKKLFNTVYNVSLEGISLLFLGALSEKNIDMNAISALGNVDILFLPIAGGDLLDAAGASALVTKLEAKVIIPMHYDATSLKTFLKEEGNEAKPQEKLTIKKKDVSVMEGKIIVLSER